MCFSSTPLLRSGKVIAADGLTYGKLRRTTFEQRGAEEFPRSTGASIRTRCYSSGPNSAGS